MDKSKKNPIIEKELEIQKFWQDNRIFEKTLEATKDGELYSFYDGPPFATGTPHYGHLVASIMKDVVPRYQTMNGRYVQRRWGWDCHGLPIENIVEQELGLKSRKDIEKIGIEKFNQKSRESVLKFADEWKKTIPRLGRWVDMENDYKTMEPWYMESIWWVFKELWDKKLIYEGHKAMHICPHCETTLANFEVTQGYKDISDLSVTVKFEIRNPKSESLDLPEKTYVLAWTTTPWTLIGNVALAVGKDIDYVLVSCHCEERNDSEATKQSRGKNSNDFFILAKDLVEKFFVAGDYEIMKEFKGKELVGRKYQPLFDYYQDEKLDNQDNLYIIVDADFISTADGTGVVHIAPAFGEEDMMLGQEKNLPMIQHIDESGRFKPEVKDFAGLEVKPRENPQATDKKVLKFLSDKVFASEQYEHSYPHCWRCDTPLLNYATSSWFVKVTTIKKDLIKNNQEINWVPAHLKDGRFGKWLEEAKDWAISRSRFWGAPLPVWQSDDGDVICVGSTKELEELSGVKVEDLHKDVVDKIEITKNGKTYHRIPEVLDCWFESGSMPYAQFHYPFENEEVFKKSFPAEFIAEGVDQTRGWFYTLLVLSTALFDQPAFKNVIANGIILAGDGNKMSKRLKNYPEPEIIMEKYGADALRYYLLSSPVMTAENLNFSEAGVKESYQKVIMLINNILKFYKLYQDESADTTSQELTEQENVLDQWLLSKLNLMISETTDAMENYNLPKAVRPIQEFIDEFSTWWLRRSRDRFKSDDAYDKADALKVFNHILYVLSRVMAPFTPFVAEYIYQEIGGQYESVHLEQWPTAGKVDQGLLDRMEQVRKIVEQGLAIRAEQGIKVRQPLNRLKVESEKLKGFSEELINLIKDELNVKEVELINQGELEFDIRLTDGLKAEGMVRELIRTINAMRKKQSLTISDNIKISWQSDGDIVISVLTDDNFLSEIKNSTLCRELVQTEVSDEAVKVNDEEIKFKIEKV